MKREPLTLTMLIVAVLQMLVHTLDLGTMDTDLAEGIAGVVALLLGTWVARQKVMPVETIRQAGHDPEQVKADAANPDILPAEG